MHTKFESDDTDAVLLIDAFNAFNELNRAAALHNIRVLCPVIAIYTINTYRQPAQLFVNGGKEIVSAEGTTQGNPLAMGLYALSIQPLITSTSSVRCEALCWFAYDASGAGFIMENRTWWEALTKLAQQEVRTKRLKELEHRAEHIKELTPRKTQRALDLVAEKGSSAYIIIVKTSIKCSYHA